MDFQILVSLLEACPPLVFCSYMVFLVLRVSSFTSLILVGCILGPTISAVLPNLSGFLSRFGWLGVGMEANVFAAKSVFSSRANWSITDGFPRGVVPSFCQTSRVLRNQANIPPFRKIKKYKC